MRVVLIAISLAATLGAQTVILGLAGDNQRGALGSGVTPLGDVNGDGIDDFATAGLLRQLGPVCPPFVRVYSGADGSVLDTVDGFAPVLSDLKVRMAGAGDVDGDGTPDLVVGVWRSIPSALFNGAAYVFSGANRSLLHTWNGFLPGDDFGFSVATAGDVNADGFDDVLVGAPQAGIAASGYFELHSGLGGGIIMAFGGWGIGDRYGWSVGSAGDFDGDGTLDVIIGAPDATPPGAPALQSGAAQVISGATSQAIAVIFGPGTGSKLGRAVGSMGDMDGDGNDDVVLSAPGFNVPGIITIAGGSASQIYYASAGITSGDGSTLAVLPDVDGDGTPEILAGSGTPGPSNLALDRVRMLSGASGSVSFSTPATSLPFGGDYRQGLAALSDLTGDGVIELLVGDWPAGSLQAGRLRVLSATALPSAGVTNLGPGFSPAGSPPQLSVLGPVLGSSWTLGISGAVSGAAGFLVAAPAPAAPATIPGGPTIYPDLARVHEWLLLPVVTSPGGFWSAVVQVPLAHPAAGFELVLQAWFPAPAGPQFARASNGRRVTFGY